ncbi:MAG: 16S rRNA (cytosine(1402)-N(4))-methyltransferase RsmH [Pyrinomonadaceae bacterium]|nr:16S rRNA (cytosine(1402)-N(4))-methyltransferase RsmH [Pyrinomonadaceae bacterium]
MRQASEGGKGAPHRPVLLEETLRCLLPERGGLFVDCTLGLGGHAEAILERSAETRVIGVDRDREALRLANERLAGFGSRFKSFHGDFREIRSVLREAGERTANGVLADLGVSSLQFDTAARGFSFRFDAPLDMRMNAGEDEETAAELLARLSEEEIARVIFEYGEERKSRRIARRIVGRRDEGRPVSTTRELAELVERAVGHRKGTKGIHPATRTFQALRIATNRELENLDEFLETAIDLLQPQGRLVVISFHSLEDRIVKHTLRRLSGKCECDPRAPLCSCGAQRKIEILTKRPLTPTEVEIYENPRARSAKLRACAKLDESSVD